jgi:cytoskeletal protein CcmA (bactofilin family)
MKWLMTRKKRDTPSENKEADFFVPKYTVIHGSMDTPVPCRIEGAVEGDVSVKGTLIISVAAEVTGNIYCDDIIVYGKVGGHISCTRKAWIAAGAYVEGTITAPVLEIDEMATVMNNLPGEPELVFLDAAVRMVISPSRAVINDNTWF